MSIKTIRVNGTPVPITALLDIEVELDGDTELMPTVIHVIGGVLTAHRFGVTVVPSTGVHVVLFGEEEGQLIKWRQWMAYIQGADFLAQSAHLAWGWALVLTFAFWWPLWVVLVLFAAFVCKEFIFDAAGFGAKQEAHGSPDWLDATFYALGAGVACIVLYARN